MMATHGALASRSNHDDPNRNRRKNEDRNEDRHQRGGTTALIRSRKGGRAAGIAFGFTGCTIALATLAGASAALRGILPR